MTTSPIILDFSHEDTADLTGLTLISSIVNAEPPPLPFRAHVPPHLSEAEIEHWNYDPLLD